MNKASGKRSLVFSKADGFADMPVEVRCGQCAGCRLEKSRQWAMRCLHEAASHEENCLVTLTYADEHIPAYGSLDGPTKEKRGAFALFMKRLRKHVRPRKVRYYHAGEYGAKFGRPHYHALLFGYDFPDKRQWSERNGFPVFRSEILEGLWPYGQSELGSVTFESAAYVARYIMKKVTGEEGEEHYLIADVETGEVVRLESEYATMSRRPGIGKMWLERFGGEVYPADGIVVRGRLMKPPRYYDLCFELAEPSVIESVKRKRVRERPQGDDTWDRLAVQEKCAIARMELKKRGLK